MPLNARRSIARAAARFAVVALCFAFLLGCSTHHQTKTREKKVVTDCKVVSTEYVFETRDFSYKGNEKTVTVIPSVKKKLLVSGHLEIENLSRYLSWNPLYELVEIPEGVYNVVTLPLVMFVNLCTGNYEGDFEDNDPWNRNVLPALLRICPVANTRRTLIGKRKLTTVVVGTRKKEIPAWEDFEAVPLDAKLVSVRPGKGNRKPVKVKNASQNDDGSITIVFSIGEDPDKEFITDCVLELVVVTPQGEKPIPFETKFDNLWKQY